MPIVRFKWLVSKRLGDEILDTIADWDGRIIVAAVASNLSRIQQVFDELQRQGAGLS